MIFLDDMNIDCGIDKTTKPYQNQHKTVTIKYKNNDDDDDDIIMKNNTYSGNLENRSLII